MKNSIIIFILSVFVFAACNSSFPKAENGMDAGREFVRASLNGELDKAKFYLYKDSANVFLFEKWKKDFYQKLSVEEKREYREASINMIEIQNVNDSTVNFVYANSHKPKDTTNLTIIRVNNDWMVDLKSVH